MVSNRPKKCVEINFAGLTSMKYTQSQSTFQWLLTHYCVLWCELYILKQASNLQISDFFSIIIISVCEQSINSQRNV